ncbi:MAG: NADP-dependent malic enzyme, partial [Patescibacteria group bacterium]
MDKSEAIKMHLNLAGKIQTGLKVDLTPENLRLLYTPGVGEASMMISEQPETASKLTIKGNTIAVVSDGAAVLGLGNIGGQASLPVMEGKAMLFKALADVNAFPICLDTQDTEEIIKTIINIAPNFAGINLEDISAPRCYEIEKRLQEALNIPVMHDDQHATAIIILAGLINASKVLSTDLQNSKIIIIGAGPAGYATTKLLKDYGINNVIVCDSKGAITSDREDIDQYKQEISTENLSYPTSAEQACAEADVIIGLSREGAITEEMIRSASDNVIVFALANPTPEIMPDVAKRAGAKIIATGRSDFPNQLNNVLVFPGIFKGMVKNNMQSVTPDIKIKTAEAISSIVDRPTVDNIIPSVFDERVSET